MVLAKVSVIDAAGVKQVRAVIECLRQQMRELIELRESRLLTWDSRWENWCLRAYCVMTTHGYDSDTNFFFLLFPIHLLTHTALSYCTWLMLYLKAVPPFVVSSVLLLQWLILRIPLLGDCIIVLPTISIPVAPVVDSSLVFVFTLHNTQGSSESPPLPLSLLGCWSLFYSEPLKPTNYLIIRYEQRGGVGRLICELAKSRVCWFVDEVNSDHKCEKIQEWAETSEGFWGSWGECMKGRDETGWFIWEIQTSLLYMAATLFRNIQAKEDKHMDTKMWPKNLMWRKKELYCWEWSLQGSAVVLCGIWPCLVWKWIQNMSWME